MTQLEWNAPGERIFEVGCDRGVFYPRNAPGVPWNGIVSVTEDADGGNLTAYFMDGEKYDRRASPINHKAVLEAYTYPAVAARHFGQLEINGLVYSHQRRLPFDFSYRTLIGNDILGAEYSYRLNFVYNAMVAKPSSRARKTIAGGTDVETMSWDIDTIPEVVPGARATAYFSIDVHKITEMMLRTIEAIIYGSEVDAPRLPRPQELAAILRQTIFTIRPDEETGYWALDTSGHHPDIISTDDPGYYNRGAGSRLVPAGAGYFRMGDGTEPEPDNTFTPTFRRSF